MNDDTYDWVRMVAWANPYTQPPDGRPRMLAEDVILDWPHRTLEERRCPEWLDQLAAANPGYSIIGSPSYPFKRRKQSAEAKAQARRKRMAQRIEKKAPLFAEQFVAEELEHRPAFYAGTDPEYDVAKEERIDEEAERLNQIYEERHARGR